MYAAKGCHLTQLTAVNQLLDPNVSRGVFAHKAKFYEPAAARYFGFDHFVRFGGGDCQRFFAQHRFTSSDTGYFKRSMKAVRRGDQNCFDIGEG